MRNYELETKTLWLEIRDRLVWGDYPRVHELFTLLTQVYQQQFSPTK